MHRIRTLLLMLVLLAGCRTAISPYSHTAYLQATSLKAKSLRMMDKAVFPFDANRPALERLQTDLDAANEYAKGRPRNRLSARQWTLLLAEDHNLLGGFFLRWQADSTLNPVFIQQAKGLVSEAFDAISALEAGKVGGRESK